ncbi:MAG: DUF1553 domain-containing protein [Mariniblastus sp.]|nr:DUF1553 domain-containing protein [Mariniblastus sp.]
MPRDREFPIEWPLPKASIKRVFPQPFFVLAFLLISLQPWFALGQSSHKPVSFIRDVRPILSDKCFQCHGPDSETREADLRFDRENSALQVIDKASPQQSELLERILHLDPDVLMPPPEANKPLTAAEIETLTQWIQQGANWSEFWAYVKPLPQTSRNLADNGSWIDELVAVDLKRGGLPPSPPADKRTLLRRVYFDLTGLPPSPEKIDSFLADKQPDAFDRVVDELLASPQFGERMAIYWLDLVRYADTVGYHGDQPHNISPYRDWVINAFNSNLRFDQFTREQIAGDLIENANESQLIASGYNRLLQTTHEGGLQPREYSAIYAADRVRNVSLVWMGATVGCAQCHDHKYDPYTIRDFYSLSAFFADIDDEAHFKVGTNSLPTKRPPEILVLPEADRLELDSLIEKINGVNLKLASLKTRLSEVTKLNEEQSKVAPPQADDPPKPDRQESIHFKQIEELNQEVESVENAKKKLDKTKSDIEKRGRWTMISKSLSTPRVTRVLARGDWMDESGEIVAPAIPNFLGEIKTSTTLNRMDLANWLTDAESGNGTLTARVFANRFWYLLMGSGVSRSLDDFGGQGFPPSNADLLDGLALEFIESGWNVKQLIRQIASSKTYQQSSIPSPKAAEMDPYNQYFSHQSRYRLPAELIRDNALSVAGLLNLETVGGKSIKPAQPAKYYQHLNFPQRRYQPTSNADQWRRSVYIHWQRMFLHPTLKAFDAPSREECTAERPSSNTPSAALVLMNDPIFIEAARMLAARTLSLTPSEEFSVRLERLYQLALSRSPDSEEIKLLKSLYQSNYESFHQNPETAKAFLAIGQAKPETNLDEATLATWTSIARAVLNTNEFITRN